MVNFKLKNLLLAVITVTAFSTFSFSDSPDEEALVFVGNEDFPPYSFMDGDSPSGFAVDLIKVLSATMNRDIVITLTDPREYISDLKNGLVDGLMGEPVLEELKKHVDYSRPVTKLDYAIFVLNTNNYVTDLKSLEGKVVSAPEGCICLEAVKKNRNIKILETGTASGALRKIKAGEVTAAICEKNTAFYHIKHDDIKGLKIVGSPVGDFYEYALGVKKGRKDLLQDMDRALTILENNGTIGQLRRKWFGVALETQFPWKKVSMIIGGIMGVLLLLISGLWVISLNAAVDIKTREMRLMSRKMREKDKLAVLGKLAGQIAHELRTPLSIMNNSVFLMRRDGYEDKEKFEKKLALLEDKIRLTSNVLESILSYSRVRAEAATTISVKECLFQVIKDIDVHTGISVDITFTDEERLHVFMDFHQLYSILRNLILNAVQAMGTKGTITVSVSAPEEEKNVVIRVSDTGPGLTGISSEHIFDLFSSTKVMGTGLGLPIAKSIADTNDGSLDLESTGPAGTTFVIKLPCSEMICGESEDIPTS
jgi:signal transduction histidine kinase